MLRFLFSLTCSVSSGAALAVALTIAVQHFFPAPPDHHTAVLRPTAVAADAQIPSVPSDARIRSEDDKLSSPLQQATRVSLKQDQAVAAPSRTRASRQEPLVAQAVTAQDRATAASLAVDVLTDAGKATVEPRSSSPAPQDAPIRSDPPPPANETVSREIAQVGKQVMPASESQIAIHYRLRSSPTHADAEQIASRLASSGFGPAKLIATGHVVRSPVVRYFFKSDARTANLLLRDLRTKNSSWRGEDCTSYRHKPPTGTIEVWPVHGL